MRKDSEGGKKFESAQMIADRLGRSELNSRHEISRERAQILPTTTLPTGI